MIPEGGGAEKEELGKLLKAFISAQHYIILQINLIYHIHQYKQINYFMGDDF